MKNTAIEWLIEQLKQSGIPLMKDEREMVEKAKEMEKQQIIEAHLAGHIAPSSTLKGLDAYQYYKENYE